MLLSQLLYLCPLLCAFSRHRFSFVSNWSRREIYSSRLTTLGGFEIQMEPHPWKYRPIAATSQRSSLHRAAKNPAPSSDGRDSHRQHMHAQRRKGRDGGDSTQAGAGSVLFRLEDPRGIRSAFLENRFHFFRVNIVPLLLTGKGICCNDLQSGCTGIWNLFGVYYIHSTLSYQYVLSTHDTSEFWPLRA